LSAGAPIYVVDDDAAMRSALAALFELEKYPVRTFKSGVELLAVAADLPYGCVVMDVRMPDRDGTDVQRELAQRRPDMPVILMTAQGDVASAVNAMKAGAVDFLEKPFDPDVMLASVRTASARSDAKSSILLRMQRLTSRERQVLDRLIAGDTSKEIARSFNGSPRTVDIHRARILEKLGARNVAEAVRLVMDAT
jgi:two-component system response regulator FixJ